MFSRLKSAIKVPRIWAACPHRPRAGAPMLPLGRRAGGPRARAGPATGPDHLEDPGEAQCVVVLDAAEIADQRRWLGVLGDVPLEAHRPGPCPQGAERGAALGG